MIDEPTRRLDEGALRGLGRALIPRVLAGLVRRGEDFDAAEEALLEALLDLAPASQTALTLRARTQMQGRLFDMARADQSARVAIPG